MPTKKTVNVLQIDADADADDGAVADPVADVVGMLTTDDDVAAEDEKEKRRNGAGQTRCRG